MALLSIYVQSFWYILVTEFKKPKKNQNPVLKFFLTSFAFSTNAI